MSKKAEIKNYRTSGEYEIKPSWWRKANNVLPHEAWRSKKDSGHNRGLLIAKKKKHHWSVGEEAIKTIFDAQEKGAIKRGYLVLEEDKKIISVHTINEVMEAIKGIDPNEGTEWGAFFFFDENLVPYASGDFGQSKGEF